MATKTKIVKLLPSGAELVVLLIVTLLLTVIGNSGQLLGFYNLAQSNDLLKNSTGSTVTGALAHLDSLGLTDQVVTFLIWAAVGLFCFSLVSSGGQVYQNWQRNRELSSNRYVHPAGFSMQAFWRQVWLSLAILLAGLILTIAALYIFLAFILPIGLLYCRTFLVGFGIGDIGNFLIGVALLFVWLAILDICARLIIFHRQLVG